MLYCTVLYCIRTPTSNKRRSNPYYIISSITELNKLYQCLVILKVPELEKLSSRKLRITRRLEKSIAHYEATRIRPSHITGRFRTMICGIESTPIEMCCDSQVIVDLDDNYDENEIAHVVNRGLRVDSIDYYTRDLQEMNTKMFLLQKQTGDIAAFGNHSVNGRDWFSAISQYAQHFFNEDLADSDEDVDHDQDDESDHDSLDSLGVSLYSRKENYRPTSRRYPGSSPDKMNRSSRRGIDNNGVRRTGDPMMYGSVDHGDISNPTTSIAEKAHRTPESPPKALKWLAGGKRRIPIKSVSFKPDLLQSVSDDSKKEPLINESALTDTSSVEKEQYYQNDDLHKDDSQNECMRCVL